MADIGARRADAPPADFFRLVVDRTHIPFVAISPQGVVRYASASVVELIGWEADELVGRSIFDFIDEDQAVAAMEGLGEVTTSEIDDAGIPIVFAVRHRDGRPVWLEVAALPLQDRPDLDLVALRLRPWDAQRHLNEFLRQMLLDAPLEELLPPLARSIVESLEGVAAAVHHGYDGVRFHGVAGSWPEAAALPLDPGRLRDLLPEVGAIAVVPADGRLALPSPPSPDRPRWAWMVGVGGGAVPRAVLTVWTDVAGSPLLGHRTALREAADYVQLALVRTAEHQRLVHLAGHDSLTGVANRQAFRSRLADSLADGEADLAVAFCDLDGFKEINDRYGHTVGDDLLVEVAARLGGALRSGDDLARIGGDEFTVLFRGIPDSSVVEQVAQRLLAAMEAPFAVPDGTVRVGLSIGVALASPGATADDLLAAADSALYSSKASGGGMTTVAR